MQDSSTTIQSRRIAILIDGENAQPSLVEDVIAETAKYGMVTVRRVYGDWTTPNMKGWKETLHVHAVQPIQQFRYTTGKNATDSAMIIDAMDLLHAGTVSGFCLVSSDSDYTRLATRIREKGLFAMGIGRKGTPRAFVNACEVFVYTENLSPGAAVGAKAARPFKGASPVEPSAMEPLPLLRRAFEMAVQDDGWAFLGTMGTRLSQLDPGFDSRTYGFKQLSLLIRAHPEVFELRQAKSRQGTSQISVRLKE